MVNYQIANLRSVLGNYPFQNDLPEPATVTLFIQIWDPQNPMEKILAHYRLHQIHPCWGLFSIVSSPIVGAWKWR